MLDNFLDMQVTNAILERIAVALERLAGPILQNDPQPYKRGPEALITYGDQEKSWLIQEATHAAQERGLSPAEEQKLIEKIVQGEESE